MNERIRQLTLKAGGQRDYEKYHKQPWNFSESELEKFAMLVIQQYENDKREGRRDTMSELGYSRIGRGNI
jgi:hypothetical protein